MPTPERRPVYSVGATTIRPMESRDPALAARVPVLGDRPRLRLLCLALRIPLPADNGDSMRVLGLLRSLAACHDVELVCVRRPETDDDAVEMLEGWLAGGLRVFAPHAPPHPGRRATLRRWAKALAQGDPTWLRAHWNREVAGHLSQIQESYDAVVFLDNAVTIYWPSIRVTAPFLVDVHNVAGWSGGQALASGRRTPARLLRSSLDTWLMRRSERRSIGTMEGVVVTSDEEARRLSALYGITADAVVPSAIDLPHGPLRAIGAGTVGWLGGHGYQPNRDGLLRFVAEAWKPLGRAGYRLLVAGAEPPAEILALKHVEGVEILGYVEDVDVFLSGLDVAVVPLWAGAGVKLKTVTFLGAGIPLVATSVGIEGTGVIDGVHALIRESPPDLAAGLQELLVDSVLAERIGSNGRSLAVQRLTWPCVGAEFVAVVERIAESRARPSHGDRHR